MNEKKLNEFNPRHLFLQDKEMTEMLQKDERLKRINGNKNNYIGYIVSALLAFLSTAITLLSWSKIDAITKVVYIGVSVLLLIIVSFFGGKYHLAKKMLQFEDFSDEDTCSKVIHAVKDNTSYIAVLLIANREAQGPLKFLCRKTDAYLVHCELDPTKTIYAQNELITNFLDKQFEIDNSEVIEISPLLDHPVFTIKLVHEVTKSNAFVLYSIQLEQKAKFKIDKKMKNGLKWLSIDEMKNNPTAMKLNYDIIEQLDENRGVLIESFHRATLHVIWNITKQCSYNCNICATKDDNRPELSCEDKHRVLLALCQEKARIKEIDFAGGDPCTSSESRGIIEEAIILFGQDAVSITSTAKGIESVDELEKKKILSRCEITIDASHENLKRESEHEEADKGTSRGNDYSEFNKQNLQFFSDCVRELTINIPILNGDLSNEEIDYLVEMISEIRDNYPRINLETHLIRLMPVGSHKIGADEHTKDEYKRYNPLSNAEQIKEKLTSQDIKCDYHCSLRVLDRSSCEKCGCTMLEHKIGIDCAGNVFACAWGGYLNYKDVTDNPFFLGNLLQQDLSTILDSNSSYSYKRIANRIKKRLDYCSVVSIACNDSFDVMADPLKVTD